MLLVDNIYSQSRLSASRSPRRDAEILNSTVFIRQILPECSEDHSKRTSNTKLDHFWLGSARVLSETIRRERRILNSTIFGRFLPECLGDLLKKAPNTTIEYFYQFCLSVPEASRRGRRILKSTIFNQILRECSQKYPQRTSNTKVVWRCSQISCIKLTYHRFIG